MNICDTLKFLHSVEQPDKQQKTRQENILTKTKNTTVAETGEKRRYTDQKSK